MNKSKNMSELLEFPDATRAIRYLQSTFLKTSVNYLLSSEKGYIERVERLLRILKAAQNMEDKDIESLLSTVVEFTLNYIKEQLWFQKSGRYRKSIFLEVQKEVYNNAELMEKVYLPGIYLSQLFWPIHYYVGKEFRRLMIPRIKRGTKYLEVGVGSGYILLEVLEFVPDIYAIAIDVSQYAIKFSRAIFDAAGIHPDRVMFYNQDITDFSQMDCAKMASAACMGEVLEHVEDPAQALQNVSDMMQSYAPIFITTVINSSHVDHITLFTSVEEIDDLIVKNGFNLVERHIVSPSDFVTVGTYRDLTQVYYALAVKAR